ncbi:MAG: ABC transporter ATP-binding protein [Lachnospiraceae bacterium]|nr:ABC transporter ATP-binding protein [Lachnospiraceae bacterium]
MEILEISKLSYSYGDGNKALQNVSIKIQAGEIISIVGESGSGKSTLLHGILGLLPSDDLDGSIVYEGEPLTNFRKRLIRGKEIAIIYQNAGRYFDPVKRIGKQYGEMLNAHGVRNKKEQIKIAKEMLESVHLTDSERILRSYPFELSGGMVQRVAIAMAMTFRPKLLLADEPTSALDATIQERIVRQLLELRREYHTAILLVTHNMGLASYISDYIGVMKDGKMIEYGTRDQIIDHPTEDYTRRLLYAVPDFQEERLAD